MKVTPAAASAVSTVSFDEGHSAGAERVARAVAVAAGKAPEAVKPSGDAQVDRAQASIRKIKMRTQRSPEANVQAPVADPIPAVEAALSPESPISAPTEQTQVAEASAPLSPQFAALAKEKRALQAMKRELDAQKAALETPAASTTPSERTKEQVTADLLNDLRKGTLTYDDLTQAIMSQGQQAPEIAELRAEIKALKEGLDKTQSERDQSARAQVERQILEDVNQLVAHGDEYEAIREAGYQKQVVALIGKVFDQENKILDTAEAAKLIEDELIEESLRFAKLKKVQGRLTPAQEAQVQQAAKAPAPNTKIMRTLTNRDGVSSASMDRKARAMAAFRGELVK